MISNRISFPSLEGSGILRYSIFAALYFAQGVPEGILFFALPAWFAKHDVSALVIGNFVAVAILPWSLKLINGPLMDRFSYLPMGRRKPWILFGQAGLFLSLISMSLVKDPISNLVLVTSLGFLTNFFSAFQDVATDGMAIDILPVDQQARANGIMWGAKTIGISVSVALGSWAINTIGFNYTFLIYSLIILLIMVLPLSLRERDGERLFPWSAGGASADVLKLQLHTWKSIFRSLWKVFVLPVSLIMGVVAFSMSVGRGLIDVVLPVLTVQQLGWADTKYSALLASAKMISGILGMVIGGVILDLLGKIRVMFVLMALLGLIFLSISVFPSLWHNEIIITVFFFIYYSILVFLTIAIFATAMHLCWKRVSATQFTLYMTISNLGASVGAALLGPLRKFLTYEMILLVYVLFSIISFMALRYVKFEKHKNKLLNLKIHWIPCTLGISSQRVLNKEKPILRGLIAKKEEQNRNENFWYDYMFLCNWFGHSQLKAPSDLILCPGPLKHLKILSIYLFPHHPSAARLRGVFQSY